MFEIEKLSPKKNNRNRRKGQLDQKHICYLYGYVYNCDWVQLHRLQHQYQLYRQPGQAEHCGDCGDQLDNPSLVLQRLCADATCRSLQQMNQPLSVEGTKSNQLEGCLVSGLIKLHLSLVQET